MEPIVMVHGGAWAIPDKVKEETINGVKEAATVGFKCLSEGKSALDAVEEAVRMLENNPVFDAGAVAGIQNVKNPVSVARLIMERTPHLLLVGQGASRFAATMGVPSVTSRELVTAQARREWLKYKQYEKTIGELFNEGSQGHDTVGAVAIDGAGHVACATSTGGITAKRPGRVGDSPLIGCGAYCDDKVGAVSCTGNGEAIARVCLAHKVISLLEKGLSPDTAVTQALQVMSGRVSGYGGAIVISKSGEGAAIFTTERMAWARCGQGFLEYGLDPGQHLIQHLDPEEIRERGW